MKHSINLPALLLLSFGMLVLSNCSRELSQQFPGKVSPPFERVNVAFNENTIDPASGGELKMDDGTKISVPANAFTDATGQPVKGKVKIKYRGFHNSTDILMSGIPMKYKGENFQTAGMFEVKGSTEDGQPVQIAAQQSMTVQMASFVAGDDFSFYYFDDSKNEWVLKGKTTAQVNEEKKAAVDSLKNLPDAPLKPERRQSNSLVFDLDVNTVMYPELRDFNGVVWQYAGSNEQADTGKMAWVFKEDWKYITLEKSNEGEGKYLLHLKNRNNEYNAVVSPVLEGKYYREALAKFEEKMTVYQNTAEAKKQEEQQLEREADLYRTFTVSNFGIYNWDCFYKQQATALQFPVDIKLNENVPGVNMSTLTVYLLTGKQRAVITYPKYYRNNFTFNPEDDNKLVAVLPGDRIAVFTNEDFKNLAAVMRQGDQSQRTLILKVINNQVLTAANLTDAIARI